MTPKWSAYYNGKNVPLSKLYLLENEAHFSLIRNHLKEILIQLKENTP